MNRYLNQCKKGPKSTGHRFQIHQKSIPNPSKSVQKPSKIGPKSRKINPGTILDAESRPGRLWECSGGVYPEILALFSQKWRSEGRFLDPWKIENGSQIALLTTPLVTSIKKCFVAKK